MTGKVAPPEVKIRSYRDSPICDVVVVVHGMEMALRCRDYLSPVSTLQLKLNSATYHFSYVQTEIDLCSVRNTEG